MCFNRRRNIFTLGEYQNTTNPISARVRAQIRNRQQSDVFERDPFKVQSFNFHYAERPSCQGSLSHSQIFSVHCQSRKLETKPFETYFYNHGFNFTRHDENASQTGESTSLRGRKYEEPQTATGTTANLSNKLPHWPYYTSTTNGQQADTQRQQWAHKYATPTANESHNTNEQKLSAYFERRQAAKSNKCNNTSTTSVSTAQQPSAKPDRLSQWFYGNEERVSPADATARARQSAGGTSKAMAAAVGTVGKCPNKTNDNKNSASATGRRLSSGSVGNGFTPLISNRNNVSSWRSCPTSENQAGHRGSCSTSMLGKKSNTNGEQQTKLRQQHAQRSGELQQRRMVSPTVETVVKRKKSALSRTVVQRCNSCEISINIKSAQPKQQNNKAENFVIKIESESPFKVVSNAGSSSVSNNASNMRSKRLNDLMSRKTTVNIKPRSLNITPKASSGTLEMNRWQSKHSLRSVDDSSISQRITNCERFVEREGEQLRQRTISSAASARKASNVGYVLGSASPRNRLPAERVRTGLRPSNSSRIVPRAQTVTSIPSDNCAKSRLRGTYDRQLMSLRQLRASIDAISTAPNRQRLTVQPLKRSSTAPDRLNVLDNTGRLSRQCSHLTFTLPNKGSVDKTARSISPSSTETVNSCRSRTSNSSLLN